MSEPSRISSGGCCRSPSSMTTTSPTAWSSPAVIAIWCPKERERCSTRTRSSAAAISSRIPPVPSEEPSSTTKSSNGTPSSAEATRAQNSRARPSSSSIGATTLRSRSSRIAAQHNRVRGVCEHVFVSYAELHAHSAFSFLDGASLPDELAGAAAELGYEAMALTDHNSVSGSMEFAQAAGALGLRAIHGAEIDLDDGRHITLLVEDATGWRNLCRILTRAHRDTRRVTSESRGAVSSALQERSATRLTIPPQVPLET